MEHLSLLSLVVVPGVVFARAISTKTQPSRYGVGAASEVVLTVYRPIMPCRDELSGMGLCLSSVCTRWKLHSNAADTEDARAITCCWHSVSGDVVCARTAAQNLHLRYVLRQTLFVLVLWVHSRSKRLLSEPSSG